MHIHNLYEDENGISHFRDLDIPWETTSPSGSMSARLPAHGIIFRQINATFGRAWHPPCSGSPLSASILR